MQRKRFYAPPDSIHEGIATLPRGQAHHLRHVLRIKSGEVVEIFDGSGNGYLGEVVLQDSGVVVRGLQKIPPRDIPLRLMLAAAVIKPAKFEWMLEKATELGVDEFLPLITRRSDVKIPESRIESRLQRWNRIVQEASRQCRRMTAPRVAAPLAFSDFLENTALSPCKKYLFYEKAPEPWRYDPDLPPGPVMLCLGPEGGFENGEVEQAGKYGFRICSLGLRILRAETAALAVLSIIQYQICLQNSRT
jgi:16S rRNA (uracil1498-N3)-methyltransferase